MKSIDTFQIIWICLLWVALTATTTVTYAQAPLADKNTYYFSDTLAIDIYTQMDRKDSVQPLFLYVHGGGFQGGSRNVDHYSNFVEQVLAKGFQFASMDYDLTLKGKSFSCDQALEVKVGTILDACRDISQATNFLLENQQTLGIDTSRIILAGSSAGAEAALHAAYWQDCSQDILPAGFRYAGIISMAGAILDSKWIDSQNSIPTLLFHGSCDPLVPYATAPHHYCPPLNPGFMILHGSASIANRLDELNSPYYLVTECGAGHEWHDKAMRIHPHFILDWLDVDVLDQQFRQLHHVIKERQHGCNDKLELEICD